MAFSGDPGPEERFLAETPVQEAPRLPSSADLRTSPTGIGYYDRRLCIRFTERFEIFRHYKGTDYSAKATSGAWLLMNTGDLYASARCGGPAVVPVCPSRASG